MTEIKNPILPGFTPDPSILHVGEDYYIATSTFHWNPGIQIFHSKDLANWELIAHPLADVPEVDLRGTMTPGGIWAPDLSYDAQTKLFWMTYSKMNNQDGRMFDADNYTMSATSIMGPWSKPIYLNSIGFDPSLFHDDDGRKWVVTLEWETRLGYQHPGAIVLEEFDPKQQKLIGDPVRITRGGTDRGAQEAPHLYKHGGYYYLMTAEGGTGYGHAVVLQRSKQIAGPYESDPKNPIVTSTPYYYYRRNDPDASRPDLYNPDAPLQKAGHGSLVSTQTGEWYIAHLSARPLPGLHSILGRETSIQKMVWTDDGWLRMADGSNLAKATTPGMSGIELDHEQRPFNLVDDFGQPQLDPHWLTPYSRPTKDWINLNNQGLRMRGRQSFFSRMDVSLMATAVTSFHETATTSVKFKPVHFSQSAGLVLYYDNHNWLFERLSYDEINDQTVLDVVQAKNGERTELEPVKIPVASSAAELRVTTNNDQAQFTWRENVNAKWAPVGQPVDISYLSDEDIDGFTGLMVGIGTWDAYRRESYADFSWFMTENQG